MFNMNNVTSFISKAKTKLEEATTMNNVAEQQITITDAQDTAVSTPAPTLTTDQLWNEGTIEQVTAYIVSRNYSRTQLVDSLTQKCIAIDDAMTNEDMALALATDWVEYRTRRNAMETAVPETAPAMDETTVAVQTTEEETIMTNETPAVTEHVFNKESLIATLKASGLEESMAIATAEKVAQVKLPKEEVAPTTRAAKRAQQEQEEAADVKPWFKRAVNTLTMPRKTALVGRLTMELAKSTNAKEKAEIQAEIDRLVSENGDARFKTLMNGYIIKAKGWTVTASGGIAEFAYLSGDATETGVRKATAAVGKSIAWTGEKITTSGKAIEKAAPKAGQIARVPFDAVGDGINIVAGNKPMPKLPKSTKANK